MITVVLSVERVNITILRLHSVTKLSGAHAFRRFLRQLSSDFNEILYRIFPSHVLTSVNIS